MPVAPSSSSSAFSTSAQSAPSPTALHPDTIAVLAGATDDPLTGAVVTPIYQTTTFAQAAIGGRPEWCYSRTGNPTRTALERAIAQLEGGKHGFAFASGLAAVNAVLQGTLRAGDHVVASRDLYGGCYRLFTKVFQRFGVAFSLVDTTDPATVAAAIEPRTRLVWLETPSNPLLKVTDIAACSAIARAHGALVVVDNTFASPVLQRPLELGADLVLHSTTKAIGGHCDVLGGAVVVHDGALAESLAFVQNATGAVPGPFDCFLLLRGIRTLPLRVRRQSDSALRVARFLEAHPNVARVHYPGLASHPQHDVAARQASGFGAVVSFELKGVAPRAAAARLQQALRLFTLAESLGGARSLLCHPATMTHASVEARERDRIGIGDGLLRLSIGLEDPRDLTGDLGRGLECAVETSEAIEVSA
ncbi:MAG: PLP-dependent transferase [Phycisphaerales bacterium]|nr:PLP-dependent transferase [Phycisphaerales bacterium]